MEMLGVGRWGHQESGFGVSQEGFAASIYLFLIEWHFHYFRPEDEGKEKLHSKVWEAPEEKNGRVQNMKILLNFLKIIVDRKSSPNKHSVPT